jgi:hypothetical protein
MLFLTLSSAWLAASAGPAVSGNASCPRPDEVAALLATMLPEDAGSPTSDHGEVIARGVETAVRLTDSQGTIVGESVLAGSCEERAHRAAVLLAIWQTRLGVEAPAAIASPPVSAATVRAPERKDIRRAGPAARLGAAAVASVDAAGLVPIGMLELQAQPWAGRVWGRLTVEDAGEKSLALEPGDARWARLTVGVGAVMELGTGWLGTSLRGDVLVSRVSVEGDGFAFNRRGTLWQAGADLGLRVQRSLSSHASIWLDFSAVAWPGQQVLSVANVTNTRRLPALEGRLALGVTFPLTP